MPCRNIVRGGVAFAGLVVVLNGSTGFAQSRPRDAAAAPGSRYFNRWGLELAVGAHASAITVPFASAGLYLDDSLAVVVEATVGRHVSGEVSAAGPAPQAFLDSPRSWPSKPAACPRVRAFSDTLMGGVQYRRPMRRVTPFAQVLGGRASHAAIASEPKADGVETSCYEAFGSGRAIAAAGGVDVHLGRRFRLRLLADYRRLAVPALEGLETVLTEHGPGGHLRLARVAVAFVLGI